MLARKQIGGCYPNPSVGGGKLGLSLPNVRPAPQQFDRLPGPHPLRRMRQGTGLFEFDRHVS
jgi:hypothetical protein